MKKVFMILALAFLITGCAGLPFPRITTPKKPDTVYNWTETSRTTPKAVITDGKVVVVESSEKTLQVGLRVSPKQLTFTERIGNWISGLGLLGIILLIIGLIVAPGATIGFLFKTARKWKLAMRETVIAIKESQAAKEHEKLKASLKDKQSTTTKKMVGNMKAEL